VIVRYCRLLLAWILMLPVAACTLAPEQKHTELPMPSQWRAPHELAPGEGTAHACWWAALGGTELSDLLRRARAGNFELEAAKARVRQADALARAAGAPLLPELALQGYAERTRTASDPSSNAHVLALAMNYELDLWGARQSASRSAQQQAAATAYLQQAMKISLDASVAQAYLQTVASRQRAALTRAAIENALQSLAAVNSQYRAGHVTATELTRRRRALLALQQQLVSHQRQAAAGLAALAALLGLPVQEVRVSLEGLDTLQVPTQQAALPPSLLLRRPDIVAMEHQLAAADADVTVARAALLPSLNLGASLGLGDERWRLPGHPVYELVAGLTMPIFNGGQLRAQRDQRSARRDEVLALYRAAIINALAEVESALQGLDASRSERRQQQQALAESSELVRLASSRHAAGFVDVLALGDARAELYAISDVAVEKRLTELEAAVTLYKALGGEWRDGACASIF
jgi:efflux transporter, outer membrane factor (OMF) lipoprotein, NodT family